MEIRGQPLWCDWERPLEWHCCGPGCDPGQASLWSCTSFLTFLSWFPGLLNGTTSKRYLLCGAFLWARVRSACVHHGCFVCVCILRAQCMRVCTVPGTWWVPSEPQRWWVYCDDVVSITSRCRIWDLENFENLPKSIRAKQWQSQGQDPICLTHTWKCLLLVTSTSVRRWVVCKINYNERIRWRSPKCREAKQTSVSRHTDFS